MKVLLVSPQSRFLNLRDRYPYGLYALSAQLEAHGHEAPVFDLELAPMDIEMVLDRERPDVLGITAVTHTRFEAIEVARRARRASPGLFIVVGGPHFTFTTEDTLTHVPEINAIVRGEGEATLVELLDQLDKGKEIDSVLGISRNVDGQVVHTADRPPVMDLDTLAPLRWDKIPLERYDHRLDFINLPCVPILTSRGCPVRCTFCAATHMWGLYPRRRHPALVVDEIAEALERFNLKGVRFNDDALTLSRSHVLALCDAIEQKGVEFSWACQVRVDTVDYALLSRMKEAGCYFVAFGVETAASRLLESIHKKISLEQVKQTLSDCQLLGLKAKACFMYALPDETDAERYQTFHFMERISEAVTAFSITPTIIYPGTGVERLARARGVLAPEFSWSEPYYNAHNATIGTALATVPLYTEALTSEEIAAIDRQLKTDLRVVRAVRSIQNGSVGEVVRHARRYIAGFSRVRNQAALKERLRIGRQVFNRLSNRKPPEK